MPIETSVTHIADLEPLYPLGTDNRLQGDNHIRNIKTALKNDLPLNAPSTAIGRSILTGADAASIRTIIGVPATSDVYAKTETYSDTETDTAISTAIAAIQTVPAGAISAFAMNTAPTGWLKANGAAVSRTTYATLFAALISSATVTMTIASPGVVTWTSHGRSANDPIKFSTTGALPTGFVAGTTYYVVGASITTNTFQLSATAGGTAINTTGTQSGVHTGIHAPHGTGDGSTTFNIPDLRGEFARGWDDGRAIDTNRSFGSSQADELKSHKHSGYGYVYGTTFALSNRDPAGGGSNMYSDTAVTGGTETRPRNIALLMCVKY